MARQFKESTMTTLKDLNLPTDQLGAINYGIAKILGADEINSFDLADIGGVTYGHTRKILTGKYLLKKKLYYKILDYLHLLPVQQSSSFVYIKSINASKKVLACPVFDDERTKGNTYKEIILFDGRHMSIGEINKMSPLDVEDEVCRVLANSIYSDFEDYDSVGLDKEQHYKEAILPFFNLSMRKIIEELYKEDDKFHEHIMTLIKSAKKYREELQGE